MSAPDEIHPVTAAAVERTAEGGSTTRTTTGHDAPAGTRLAAGAAPPRDRVGDWRLALEDRFEGDALDTSAWSVGYGWGMAAGHTADVVDLAVDRVRVWENVTAGSRRPVSAR